MKLFQTLALAIVVMILFSACSSRGDKQNTALWTDERFYQDAKEALNDNNYRKAIELYSLLEAQFPYGKYAEQAQLELIYAQYKAGNSDAALAAADRFVNINPTHINIDYAYYLKGLATFREDEGWIDRVSSGGDPLERDSQPLHDSYDAFREMVTRYPESRYVEDARKRMAHLANSMAQHEVNVAEYYFRKEAFVATINRCATVLDRYQQTPAVESALALMVRTYRRMELPQLASDAERVLSTNFPNSNYLVNNSVKDSKKRWYWPD
jgi:outer membrane protein assembly factor BamD